MAVITSEAFKKISSANPIDAGETYNTLMDADRDVEGHISSIGSASKPKPSNSPVLHTGHQVDLGTYNVGEVQICLMGSWGPEQEYVSVGTINLKS